MGLYLKGISVSTIESAPSLEAIAALEGLFKAMDSLFSESGERQQFMLAANELSQSDLHLLQSVLGGKLTSQEAQAGSESADNALRIANALFQLETTIKKSKDRTLLHFIFSLLKSEKVVKGLNRTWFFPWELPLILNKNLTAEQVRFIWLRKKEDYIKEPVPSSMRVLVKHPQCPPDVLEALLAYDDGMLRKSIALHKNISTEIAHFFLNSQRKPERLNLSLSRYATSETLLSLLDDKYDEIIKSARKNLTKRFPEMEITDEAIQKAIRKNIVKPFVRPTASKPVFNPIEAETAGVAGILAMSSEQRKRIADSSSDPQILALLAQDSSKAVRRAVAKKGFAGQEVLRALAKDSDTETSNNALKVISRINPDIRAEELLSTQTLDAAYRQIALHVSRNSSKPYYKEISTTQDTLNFEQTLLVAAHTDNPLIQLMIVKDLERRPASDTARWKLLSALTDNWNLSDAVARKIVVQLQFGPRSVIERCKSIALLKELLEPGNIEPHDRSSVEARLRVLAIEVV
jgi:hypothetical protein